MKRKIIEIDREKCNGCGLCIPNCPEGALQVIDGKARLVSDLFCDGLGACIGNCPRGAIRTVEREAEPYDERRVMANVAPQGANTIAAHLKHLKSHGEFKLYEQAVAWLNEHDIPVPEEKLPCGCPGSMSRTICREEAPSPAAGAVPSQLRQWPVQIKLAPVNAPYFDGCHLLIAADCTAYAYGNFHQDFIRGRVTLIGCPKLDEGDYTEKLTAILAGNDVKSVTVVRMTVPCCGGIQRAVQNAVAASGKNIPLRVAVVAPDGTLQ